MFIDSHQHFWKLNRGDYDWLKPTDDLKPLYRDFLPSDLEPKLKESGIGGTILVQAAETFAETEFLLELAEKNSFILGVVAWIEMKSQDAPKMIENLSKRKFFCGIRPMIHTIPDVDWMLQTELTPSFQALIDFNLTFDAVVYPQHLPNLTDYSIRLITRHPNLKVAIYHAAKPAIKNQLFEPWASHMKILASFPQTFCKLCGLLTEAGNGWSRDEIFPYLDHIFDSFGYQKIMWGSDWPVSNLAADYSDWFRLCFDYVSEKKNEAATAAIFGGVAKEFYQIEKWKN